ncbi:flagellar protein FlaG [Alkalispirochaeta americana]|uniref:Flagellar protein FlaG n=1 Tax=Alkalispirochaeta americana TaxID=159291 RepID=A0A1N6WG42_9SPIO|nr:flagellar protein FlaG [Alkalispirochaeta americana]SIQ88950.1 flagellar protein FlaG [Alkalispirochaeta americana]
MALEITPVLHQHQGTQNSQPRISLDEAREKAKKVAAELREQHPSPEEIRKSIAELRRVTRNFNKQLNFSYNEDLGQMIVKVIDRNTDTVIRELPPAELQRVHIRIREAIGLLFDETI